MSTRTHKIAVIPGDGIGIEVTASAVEVLKTVEKKLGDFHIEYTDLDYSSARYKSLGSYSPQTWLTDLLQYSAILFGAVGDPHVPDHISLWELILPMRQKFQQYVNVRPNLIFPGVQAATRFAQGREEMDWVIIRENTEGEYSGQGGRSHIGTAWETATEVGVFTRHGCERAIRFGFEVAKKRDKKLLTLVTKSNAQRFGMTLWDDVAAEVAQEYPEVKWDKMLVDAMTVRMIAKPKSLDTIVCTNLHGDILSDLAAGLSGSIGIAPSSSLDPTRKYPSLFEPVHGAAFDIMGKNLANPVAAIWSAAEMLGWLGETEAQQVVMQAVEKSLAEGKTTGDLGGKLRTSDVTEVICGYIRG